MYEQGKEPSKTSIDHNIERSRKMERGRRGFNTDINCTREIDEAESLQKLA